MSTETDRPHDADLHRVLHDAVEGVEPRHDAADLRGLARQQSRAHWVPLTIAAAMATVLALAGTAWLADRTGDGVVPDELADSPTPRPVVVTSYAVGGTALGPRLFPDVGAAETTGTDLEAALDRSLGLTTRDPDLEPAWPVYGNTVEAEVGEDVITVDFQVDFPERTVSRQDAELAVQSLVWTAHTATGTDLPVQLLFAGERREELWGVPVGDPVRALSADAVLSPVIIDSPTQGAELEGGFTVEGRANAFEANVVWELLDGDGAVVADGFTTAAQCCTLSPYSFEVEAPPGDYTLTVSDTDVSEGEGSNGVTVDTKRITVR